MFLLYHSARSDALLQEAYGPPFEPLFGPLSEAGAGPPGALAPMPTG